VTVFVVKRHLGRRRAHATGEAHAPSGWPLTATAGLSAARTAQRNEAPSSIRAA